MIFYYETTKSSGRITKQAPQEAITQLKGRFGDSLLCIYHESDSVDGLPFIFDFLKE
jgi:hypothetical protein